MELRVLEYFLAVAREQSISAAAESLHLSQPTLSTQIKRMEDKLGKQLLLRGPKGSRKIGLTEEGELLRKRAEEIMELVHKTENEITCDNNIISGDIFIGAAESESMRSIAKIIKNLQYQYPDIHVDIFSSNREAVMERLDKGLLDFGIIYGLVDHTKYQSIKIPMKDTWKVLMRKDSPLAQKDIITPDDLRDKPLILSRNKEPILQWMNCTANQLQVAATCNLVYNSAILVCEGIGYNLTLNPPKESSELCSRPMFPAIEAELNIIWKNYQVFSKASEKLLEAFHRGLLQ